jgi:hypothetical protein
MVYISGLYQFESDSLHSKKAVYNAFVMCYNRYIDENKLLRQTFSSNYKLLNKNLKSSLKLMINAV